MGLPLFGTLCTAIWYAVYRYLVRTVPLFGTHRTKYLDNFWYDG